MCVCVRVRMGFVFKVLCTCVPCHLALALGADSRAARTLSAPRPPHLARWGLCSRFRRDGRDDSDSLAVVCNLSAERRAGNELKPLGMS